MKFMMSFPQDFIYMYTENQGYTFTQAYAHQHILPLMQIAEVD